MPHLPPAQHETSKHVSPSETKIKRKTKQNCPGFEFKPRQVNDSSQSNQGTDHLVSQFKTLIISWASAGEPGTDRPIEAYKARNESGVGPV
jgi:hypothetical protein